jgi:small-conductance mechanosensitive channel
MYALHAAAALPAAERSRMERIGDNLSDFARDDGLRIVLIVLGTVIAIRMVRIVLYRIQRRVEKSRLAARGAGEAGRLTALFDVLDYLAVALVVGVGAMSALAVLGVNTGALLASAGVLGFAVGFGAQTMVKDLLNGLFLLAEGQYTIGDEITIGGVTGVVERVTLRTTTLRATNGDIHIVPSGDVRLVTNKSKGWSLVSIDTGIGRAGCRGPRDVLRRGRPRRGDRREADGGAQGRRRHRLPGPPVRRPGLGTAPSVG